MPVILSEKDEDIWLDQDMKDVNRVLPLLVPYPSDHMQAYEVSTLVNSLKNDSPECIEPKDD